MFGNWPRWIAPLGFSDPEQAARAFVFYGHFVLGLPTLMVGYFLLSPLFVRAIEGLLAKPVAAMFALRSALLRQQLSTGVWRAAGTAAALMVGLAVLVVMQTQGRSMLDGWRLPTHFPDLFMVAGTLNGLTPKEQQKVAHAPGIKSDEFMPIALASPEFGSSLT